MGLAAATASVCGACVGPRPSRPVSRIHGTTCPGAHLLTGPGFICFAFASHPALSSLHRMDDSYCLSALRSPFYPIPTPGSLPPLHPSAMHLHLSGVRYPPELSHSSLAALHSERMSSLGAER